MLSGYSYRKKLTIDSGEIDALLSDFPVLVKLTDFDFSKAKSDGNDIRFTSSDGDTLLKFEREFHSGDSYTKLLLHCNGIDTSTTFVDASGLHSPSAIGSAQIDTAQSKFGGASGLLASSSDYIQVADSTDWDLGSEDFTIEAWLRLNSSTPSTCLCARTVSASNYFYIAWEGGNLRVRDYGGTIDFSRAVTETTGSWFHLAIVRSGNDFYIFKGGVQQGTTFTSSASFIDRSVALDVGRMTQNVNYYIDGWIDEFRWSKGIARWTTDFTPETSAYLFGAQYHVKIPNISNSVDTDFYIYYGNAGASDGEDAVNVWDSNFLFVSHMKDVTTSTIKNSVDGTSKNKTSADSPIETDGLNYKAQDISSDNINLGDIDIDGNGTIEAIVNPDNFVGTFGNTIASKGNAGGLSSYADLGLFLSQTGGYVYIQTGDTSGYQAYVSTLQTVTGSWQYVAGRADGTNLSAFLGTTKQTTAQTTTPAGNSTNYRIGKFGDSETPLQYDGQIGEVRISDTDRSDTWLKATRQTLFDNLLSFGAEEEPVVADETDSFTIDDEIAIQHDITKSYSDTVTIDDEILARNQRTQIDSEAIEISEDLQIQHDITKSYGDDVAIGDDVSINLDQIESDGINISDEITVKFAKSFVGEETLEIEEDLLLHKTGILDLEETIELNENINVNIASHFLDALENVFISEESDIHLIAPVHYASKIISYNPLVIITDTDPIQIAKIDISDPVNPTWESYFVDAPGETARNAKDVIFNDTFDLLYIVCADGQVITVDISDYDIREQIDTGDTNDLLHVDQLDGAHTIYASTDDAEGEVIVIDNFELAKLSTDIRFLVPYTSPIQTALNITEGRTLGTDIRFLEKVTSSVSTDIRFIYAEDPANPGNPSNDPYNDVAFAPIARTDFLVKINGSEATDVKLDSIIIRHMADEESEAEFILARRHDDLDTGGTITNQNDVVILIAGHEEFSGKISKIEAQSETETVKVTALATEKSSNIKTVSLPMSSLNEKLHPYKVLLHNPSMDNPYIDPNDDNPRYYKGIAINLGTNTEQRVYRYTILTDLPASASDLNFGETTTGLYTPFSLPSPILPDINIESFQSQGSSFSFGKTALKITEGTFIPRQNWTYFWGPVTANNFLDKREVTALYVGTSMSVWSLDAWELLQVRYRYQRVRDDLVTFVDSIEGGAGAGSIVQITDSEDEDYLSYEYRIGEAPFKNVSTRKGIFTPTSRWEDRDNGLYSVLDDGYNYTKYIKTVADLEYEKLKGTNGQVLPKTSADVELMLDGYYYYNPSLSTRINIDNTTTSGIYANDNGFPTSVKVIEISSNSMRVKLSTDNQLAQHEIDAIDELMPDDEDKEFFYPSEETVIVAKYDPNRKENVT